MVYFVCVIEDFVDYFLLSVVILDIDYFKVINDIYGYDVGDDVLVYIIKLMKVFVRVIDIVVCIGGEEFFIIFLSVNLSDVVKFVEKMCVYIENNLYKSVEIEYRIMVSFGV